MSHRGSLVLSRSPLSLFIAVSGSGPLSSVGDTKQRTSRLVGEEANSPAATSSVRRGQGLTRDGDDATGYGLTDGGEEANYLGGSSAAMTGDLGKWVVVRGPRQNRRRWWGLEERPGRRWTGGSAA